MEGLQHIASLVFVFALLGVALWALRRGGRISGFSLGKGFSLPSGRARSLSSIDRLALSPQHALHLIRLGDREMVVATYPQGCTVLAERPSGEAAS